MFINESRILSGHGAYLFASKNNLQLVDPVEQITRRARDDWTRWKSFLNAGESIEAKGTFSLLLQDTVGAVTFDAAGRFAAGVSRYSRFTLYLLLFLMYKVADYYSNILEDKEK